MNFFDTAIRSQAVAEVPGAEGVGVVAQTGEGVHDFAPGDRVAWLTINTHGSYAEQIVLPANGAVPVPDAIDDETAAALLLQGLTADHFATASHPVRPGAVALVHAAAGGVGMMLTQIVKARGGTVIGLVSRPEKVKWATDAGADHVLVSTGDAFVGPVRELTGGEGVHVVFDGAGASTFAASLQVLRTHGTMVFYGPLIGDVPTIAMNDIPRSTRLTYGVTEDHIRTPEELRARTAELFTLAEKGELVVRIGGRYPLAEAAKAHADIESRTTTGKLLLIP
ncbi:Alcohol dehydrogenase zinc-binding domain protein [Streptomyces bingchenggensis BCW-1]|uniref:Alcohol dehydrogenase zinc-binding domain protein n=1 Tax=Streptomyces bingchenggensis (strain BCW-1) TaxID=749414 RepID=D7CD85_STRBB|nr:MULTISPECIES: quinone oxidoreductase [Streptomyces]ADI12927.1 Alcohol dehydrogenase zinc-binding domain protein [Streptomyces bingchenggensis BCW-1]